MFVFPSKNIAQCTGVQSILHSIWEQNDFKTNFVTTLKFRESIDHQVTLLMIDRFVKLESCNKVYFEVVFVP